MKYGRVTVSSICCNFQPKTLLRVELSSVTVYAWHWLKITWNMCYSHKISSCYVTIKQKCPSTFVDRYCAKKKEVECIVHIKPLMIVEMDKSLVQAHFLNCSIVQVSVIRKVPLTLPNLNNNNKNTKFQWKRVWWRKSVLMWGKICRLVADVRFDLFIISHISLLLLKLFKFISVCHC